MDKNMLNDLLDLTDETADAVNLKLIQANEEHDEFGPEVAEAAQAAYEFLAKANELGLNNADFSKLEWAKHAVKVFETRRESLEQRIDNLVALNHGEVRYNLARSLNQGPLLGRGNSDPEFERLLAAERDAATDWVGFPITDAEKTALLKAIAGWDGYDRETGETDYAAEELLRGVAERLKATAPIF
jgi:hypothetical protein